ncbi:MAG: calcium-translocating P-type ATPase, PMCA-type [Erysipelotrichaceae bacterium]|nr:calcium-translocating P-type ATPase, PMCA-type [Erysipelotrichaceae bacterium]
MFHNKDKNEVIKDLSSNFEYGLKEEQIIFSREKYGKNELVEQKKTSLFVKFLQQFTDPLIIVLIIAAVVSVVIDPHEWIESLIILIVVMLNAILGVYQENNAEKSLETLKKMSAPNAKAIRNGERISIPSSEIVVGDIVSLEAGDYVPSDGRIIESFNLQVDESALTGESLPVNKISSVIDEENCALGDMKNMAFASTVCTYGRGTMIVTSVGMKNEVGKIASMLMSETKEVTPLQIKLSQVSNVISIMCFVICIVVFGLELYSGLEILDAFKTAVALAVAAIPEGLATVVTIVLSMGVTKMVKKNAIIRRLPAVETLGSASIVCSDKTGTLTQNKMTVVKTFRNEEINDFEENESTKELLRYFTLCTDAEVKRDINNKIISIGDPTEIAMVEASFKMGDTKELLKTKYTREGEIAFDSSRKMMTVFYSSDEGIYSYTKGAPDVILSRCTNSFEKAYDANETMANDALRVLAIAIKKWDEIPVLDDSNIIESDMEFIGLIGMIDPPRVEVKKAIEEAKRGGIKTVMITGDHITTASAIAKQLGILNEGQKAITGLMLNEMDDETLFNEIENISVYARVAPEHKVRIVNMWKSKGKVVAMTGDGVNDSPALKAADIGCAMGITGTDVTKNAADMILTDDNFATIISAVKEGRGIYNNIKKDVHFLLSSNIGEVFTIFVASLVNSFGFISLGIPLMPVHLLWVNLVTDTLPAFALGMEPASDDIMNEKPRAKDESFFANGLWWTIVWQGIMVGMLTLTSYVIGNNVNHEIGMSMAFMTISISQLFHSFNIKSSKSIFNKNLFNNKYLIYSLLIGLSLQFIVMYTPINSIFNIIPLSINYLSIAFALAICPVIIVEIIKFFKK